MSFKDWYCSRCSLQFDKKIIFDMHLSIVHKEITKIKEEPLTCENETMKMHVSSVHEGKKQRRCDLTAKRSCHSDPKIKKTYSCSICLEVLPRNDVKKHILKVHGVQCKICQEIVKDTTMEEHIALLHLIKCSFCSKKIAQGEDMKAHVASVHGQFCPEKLTYKNMHHHMKVFHKKISKDQLSTKVHKITNKKFECPLCSTIFSSHQERANHKKLKH